MEEIRCHICGEDKTDFLFSAGDYLTGTLFRIVRCTFCGFRYVNPRPLAGELDRYYPTYYYGDRRSIFEGITSAMRSRRVKKAFGREKPGTILDVGCGKGGMLRALKEEGWTVLGTEYGAKPRDPVGDSSVEIIFRDLEACPFSEDSFDVVTLWHVLEHLPNPRGTLQIIRKILRPGGILILSVPNMQSLQSKLTRNHWFHLDPPRHLFNFSMGDLCRLLDQEGFVVEQRRRFSFEYDTFGLTQSVLNLLIKRQNLLFDLLTHRGSIRERAGKDPVPPGRKGKLGLQNTWFGVCVSFLLAPPLFFLSLFFCPLESFLGYGGTIELVARKVEK